MPVPQFCAIDDLEVVALADAPRLCALYRHPEPADQDDLPPGVAGWVLAWPDGSALTVLTEGDRPQIISAPLSSVERRWSALLCADLVAIAHHSGGSPAR
ncbi:hypothetical protein [Micromonospora sp. NPDC049679]|uniref:hypothetical protein n=1 Tax=Micromonospora sp. NPDC049679 TaxID=3155920 RepID=UPI0033D82540